MDANSTTDAPSVDPIQEAREELGPLPRPENSAALGSHLRDGGAHFAVWAPRASRVELALVAEDRSQRNHDMTRGDDGVWSVFVPGVEAEQCYGYRVHGDWEPPQGKRFNPARLLLDPYARAITGGVDYNGPILDHPSHDDYELDPTDSLMAVPLSVVVAPSPPPKPVDRRRPMSETIVYEAHLKGMTQLHPAVPEHLRGTYAGLAYPAVIEHLLDLGVTAIQLLPVQHFVSEPFIVGRGLSNYWGYNTLGFFAPHAAYSAVGTLGHQVTEFKDMVSAFHEAGIEVILDVVYNHTGEGGHEGPTLSFRGIDHAGYYRLTDDLHNDYDVTGCGNSVDTSQPGVLDLILNSLRYWVTDMGVDGFRFDLATELIRDEQHHVDQNHPFKQAFRNDPVLSQVKLIAEPWDMGPYGYQVGQWGQDWSEWNDRFRDYTRDYWRSQVAGVRELATRLSGSSDVFNHGGRPVTSSVNFITAHDGFTLRDVVSYNDKHNEANGEDNRDGHSDNRSWNCGAEGDTDDEAVTALRHRQAKNLMGTLVLAAGVPMLTAGDEMGRTQQGNNNAYCQDSPISWVHWDTREEWGDLYEFTRNLLRLRAQHPVLRPEVFREAEEIVDDEGADLGRKEVYWFAEDGPMTDGHWNDDGRRSLGMYVSDEDDAFLVWHNSSGNGTTLTLPSEPWAEHWKVVASSGVPGEHAAEYAAGAQVELHGHSLLMLQATFRDDEIEQVGTAGSDEEE
ncbi:glycogen debranching protein GlgX [Parenemella sanctibonifatiensis]|uniref:Glycogen debranching enzyme GlgX n=1 Tax=Parenemella sanctibonifatiensis TaxID=2016505 RepID=A0A255EIB1_9ACTN|nr:glycogen debranching protein GlgX [Parenemella sanctibonifatiensis]OYN90980.1 glycogen debranching enzyme GlgX [Parenemella sanctibonifatiensis]